MSMLPRPGQFQPRDMAGPYAAPRLGMDKPPTPPSGHSAIETSVTGRQPYAGKDPMMARVSSPTVAYTAPMSPPLGRGALDTGMQGVPQPYGVSPTDFHPSATETTPMSGERARAAVREMVRSNGAMPADLERAMAHPASGANMQTMQPGPRAVGISRSNSRLRARYESMEPGSGFRR